MQHTLVCSISPGVGSETFENAFLALKPPKRAEQHFDTDSMANFIVRFLNSKICTAGKVVMDHPAIEHAFTENERNKFIYKNKLSTAIGTHSNLDAVHSK